MLQPDQIALMHPRNGWEAVRQLFDLIQRCKRGQALVRLDVVFYTSAANIFGYAEVSWHFDPPTVSTTMTIIPLPEVVSNLSTIVPAKIHALGRRSNTEEGPRDFMERWHGRIVSAMFNGILLKADIQLYRGVS